MQIEFACAMLFGLADDAIIDFKVTGGEVIYQTGVEGGDLFQCRECLFLTVKRGQARQLAVMDQ